MKMKDALKKAITETKPQSERVTRARMAIEDLPLRSGMHGHEMGHMDKRKLAIAIDELVLARLEEMLEP